MEYKIVAERNVDVPSANLYGYGELTKAVNHHIKEGWQPIGGIVPDHSFIYQAMIRHEKEE